MGAEKLQTVMHKKMAPVKKKFEELEAHSRDLNTEPTGKVSVLGRGYYPSFSRQNWLSEFCLS